MKKSFQIVFAGGWQNLLGELVIYRSEKPVGAASAKTTCAASWAREGG
jgi:hypothetical protein